MTNLRKNQSDLFYIIMFDWILSGKPELKEDEKDLQSPRFIFTSDKKLWKSSTYNLNIAPSMEENTAKSNRLSFSFLIQSHWLEGSQKAVGEIQFDAAFRYILLWLLASQKYHSYKYLGRQVSLQGQNPFKIYHVLWYNVIQWLIIYTYWSD